MERHTFHRVRATESTSTTYSHPETFVVMCDVRVASLLKDVREGEVCVKVVERDEALNDEVNVQWQVKEGWSLSTVPPIDLH